MERKLRSFSKVTWFVEHVLVVMQNYTHAAITFNP